MILKPDVSRHRHRRRHCRRHCRRCRRRRRRRRRRRHRPQPCNAIKCNNLFVRFYLFLRHRNGSDQSQRYPFNCFFISRIETRS